MNKIRSINPYHNEILAEVSYHGKGELEAIISSAHVAFKNSRNVTVEQRCQWIESLAIQLMKGHDKHAKLISEEMGKPITESRAEVEKCAWLCRHYAEKAPEYLEKRIIQTDADYSAVHYEALGAVLGVMPWNFPYWQAFRFFVPAILAGNATLLKHASNVPQCALAIKECFDSSDIPNDLFQVLMISGKDVGKYIAHDLIQGVSLTGSEPAGSSVAEIAGKEIKPSLLELGGNNSMIICADAEIEKAVDLAVSGRYQNSGQSCIAAKRILVVESLYEDFLSGFVDRVKNLKVGDPLEESTEIGVLAREDLALKLDRQVNKSLSMGAKLICGGDQKGAFYSPTVITNVTEDMPLFLEETFGPVAAITRVASFEEAIKLSNKSRFGLGVSIVSGDAGQVLKSADQFEEGAVFINSIVKSDPRLPFGGVKKSGYGRELSMEGILHFTNKKTVYVSN